MTEVMVCVITMKRPDQLGLLLNALGALATSSFGYSITVVDNDKAGSAHDVCKDYLAKGPVALHYEIEPEPGIVAARNRCVSIFLGSSAQRLVFIDDDELPQSADWLENMVACSDRYSADIVVADVLSSSSSNIPTWATEILYSPSNCPEGTPKDVFYTGNLLLTRKVLETVTPAFDQRFALTGASDYHFAIRCGKAGFQAVFADAPVLEEFPASRATVRWFMRRGYRSGAGHTRSHLIEDGAFLVFPKSLVLSLVRFALGSALLVRGTLSANKTYLVKGLFRWSSALGTIAGLGGWMHQEYGELHR
ncbi:MAG: glycosyltransferase family 2 protein [Pseudomonadota bacterium]